jgi:hypothetical protein
MLHIRFVCSLQFRPLCIENRDAYTCARKRVSATSIRTCVQNYSGLQVKGHTQAAPTTFNKNTNLFGVAAVIISCQMGTSEIAIGGKTKIVNKNRY